MNVIRQSSNAANAARATASVRAESGEQTFATYFSMLIRAMAVWAAHERPRRVRGCRYAT